METPKVSGEVNPAVQRSVDHALRGLLPMLNVNVATIADALDVSQAEVSGAMVSTIAARIVGYEVDKSKVEEGGEVTQTNSASGKDRILRLGEAADIVIGIIPVTRATAMKWFRTNQLPVAARTLGGHRRIRESELRTALKDAVNLH